MERYSRFSQIHKATNVWTFRAKILRVYSYYRMNHGRTWCFVLADETGDRMEMVMEPDHKQRFPGVERREGWWVKVSIVDVVIDASDWSVTEKIYRLMVNSGTRIDVIQDPPILSNFNLLKSFDQINSPQETLASVSVDFLGILESYRNLVEHPQDPGLSSRFFVLTAPVTQRLACFANGDCAYRFENLLSISDEEMPIVVLLKFWKIVRRDDDATWLESVDGVSDMQFNPGIAAAASLLEAMPDAAPPVASVVNGEGAGNGASGV